jgi:hypothetical protein
VGCVNTAKNNGFSGKLKTTKQYNPLYHLMVVNMAYPLTNDTMHPPICQSVKSLKEGFK